MQNIDLGIDTKDMLFCTPLNQIYERENVRTVKLFCIKRQNDTKYIDIREYYEKEKKFFPSKKGISLNAKAFETINYFAEDFNKCFNDIELENDDEEDQKNSKSK